MLVNFPEHIVIKIKMLNRAYRYGLLEGICNEFTYSACQDYTVKIPDNYIRDNTFLISKHPAIVFRFYVKNGVVTKFERV